LRARPTAPTRSHSFPTTPTDQWNFLGYVIAGFNDASPDYGVGGAATYKF
jgi:hypothetical protein